MSMQVDFEYPRQVEDITLLKAAISNFEKNMNHMMVLMKEVGNALEKVSHSYEQLTSLSFSKNYSVRQYVVHFMEEVTAMKEGAPFKEYNTMVHKEVLLPVKELKNVLKEAQKQREIRERAYKGYVKAKDKVDKMEAKYARKSKPLETCAKYPVMKQEREQKLEVFKEKNQHFQDAFSQMVEHTEGIAESTMTRYLHLNADYFAAIIDCLTKTDPTVVEAVEQYRMSLKRERQRSIQQEISRLREEEEEYRRASAPGDAKEDSVLSTSNFSAPRRLPFAPVNSSSAEVKGPPMASLEAAQESSAKEPIAAAAKGDPPSAALEEEDPVTERDANAIRVPSDVESENDAGDADAKLPPPLYEFNRST